MAHSPSSELCLLSMPPLFPASLVSLSQNRLYRSKGRAFAGYLLINRSNSKISNNLMGTSAIQSEQVQTTALGEYSRGFTVLGIDLLVVDHGKGQGSGSTGVGSLGPPSRIHYQLYGGDSIF